MAVAPEKRSWIDLPASSSMWTRVMPTVTGAIVLGDLVPFWKIRIEVVLACENRDRMYETIQGDRGAHCELDGPLVEDGEGARKGEAHRANVAVGRRTKVGGASAEGLGARFQLHVDLESDDHLMARPRAGDGRLDR